MSTQHKFVSVRSFSSLDDILNGNNAGQGSISLEAAKTGRVRLTSAFKSEEDFVLEMVCHQLPAPVAISNDFAKSLLAWHRSRQFLTGLVITGDNQLAEGLAMDDVRDMLIRSRVMRMDDEGPKAGVLEHVVPNGLVKSMFLVHADKLQGTRMSYPWKIPAFWTGTDKSNTDMVPVTMEDVQNWIDVIQDAEADFHLPMAHGPLIPLGAATPKPVVDADEMQRSTHFVDLRGWIPGKSTVFKLRIECRQGRLSIFRAIPEVEAKQDGKYDASKKVILQEAGDPDRSGRPRLVPLAELPALERECKFLTESFVRREWLQTLYPEFRIWLTVSGLEVFMLQNLYATPYGKKLLDEIREDQIHDAEERAKAKEAAAAGAPFITPAVNDDPAALEAAIAAAAEELVPEVAPLAGEVPVDELVPETAPLVEAAGDDVVSEETDTTSEEEQEAEEIPAEETHESVPA